MYAITDMRNACDAVKCVDPSGGERMNEATVHEVLDKSKALAVDILDTARFISSTLFGGVNSDIPPRREILCARDAMEDITRDLMDIYETLNYIKARL